MYGMVHEGLRSMVVERGGTAAWARVSARAGANGATFLRMQGYPDELSAALVVGAAEEFGRDTAAFLREFGRYWVGFALATGYGSILRSSGGTLAETLSALDEMHARIGLSIPGLRLPSFKVEPSGNGLLVHYFSARVGLAPFVVGLVEGLASMHGTSAQVEHVVAKGGDADHDEFLVRVVA